MNVVMDAQHPTALAVFWADLLGWHVEDDDPVEVNVRAPDDDAWDLNLLFIQVPEPKTEKSRIHLELASRSPEHQAELVERALDLGASRADVGQGDVPWVVLADPEGNEFCVLEPRPQYTAGAMAAILVEAVDHVALAEFWSAATGWPIEVRKDEIVALRSPRGQWLEILNGEPAAKTVKNRVHFCIAPHTDGDQAAAIAELRKAGAAPVDIGQGDDVSWVVMTDPEGNEFCVLTPR